MSIPESTASIQVQVRVRATTGTDGSAELTLESDQATVSLFELSGDETTGGWVTMNRSVSSSEVAGETADLAVSTHGEADVEMDYVAVPVDSTGSGLPDAVERLDLRMPTGPSGVRGTPLDMDPTTNDTDGDGLVDGAEVTVDWWIEEVDGSWQVQGEVTNATSHPAMADTDDDSIFDGKEVAGWNVTVVNKTAGEHADENPYRWHSGQAVGPDESTGTVRFDSDPLQADTDGDQITDEAEKEQLHTDPRQKRTYEVTGTREELLHALYEAWDGNSDRSAEIAQAVDAMDISVVSTDVDQYTDNLVVPPATMEQFPNVELTDVTDDFVSRDGSAASLERFVYETPDGQHRTDSWLPNQEEVRHDADLDPWVADSDSDGLTDGQEVHGVTKVPDVADSASFRVVFERAYLTQPDDRDSDEDDALDGSGLYVVGDHRLGRQITADDQYIDHGEAWELPTNPAYADVVEVFVVTDEEFRDQHDNHREYIKDMVQVSNRSLGDELETEKQTTILEITDWGRWKSNIEAGTSPSNHSVNMVEQVWENNDHGADIVIGFSGQEMGNDPGGSSVSEYADGVAQPATNSIMIGTNDLTVSNNVFDS